MEKFAVYCDDEFQAEFDTLAEARQYMKDDIKGMAEHYGKTQKWCKAHFHWYIRVIEYEE